MQHTYDLPQYATNQLENLTLKLAIHQTRFYRLVLNKQKTEKRQQQQQQKRRGRSKTEDNFEINRPII